MNLRARAEGGRVYLWCAACAADIRIWGAGDPVSLVDLIEAETEHRAVHQPAVDYGALYDGIYDGRGEE